MIIMQMNVKMLSQVIPKVMIQIMQLYKLWLTNMESHHMQDIDRYREETEYLNL